jgi:hypothetical protein
MSAITSDWTLSEAEAPTRRPVAYRKECSREEEFRSALESYMAAYADDQKHRGETTAKTGGTRGSVRKLAMFVHQLRLRIADRAGQQAQGGMPRRPG